MNRTRLIDQFEAGGSLLASSISGLGPEQLTAHVGPGDWTIHELVIHLVDSDAIGIDRMKRVLTEDSPPLLYADETAYVRELFSHEQSVEDALEMFKLGRRQFTRVLRRLPDAAFQRTGQHNVTGTATLEALISTYVKHLNHHLDFLHRKRDRLGCG